MNIVLINTFFPSHLGGLEIVAGRLATELSCLGVHVDWFAGDAAPMPPATDGIVAHQVSCWNWAEARLGIPWPIWSPKAIPGLMRKIRAADLVHIHDCLYFSSFLAFAIAKVYRKPVVFTQHIDVIPYKSVFLSSLMKFATMIASNMLSWADRTVFIGSRTRDFFVARKKFKRPPMLIPNGVDTDVFFPVSQEKRAEIRVKLGIPVDTVVNLFVGRFVEKKGLNHLREMVRNSPEMTWVFLGWGPLDPRLWGEKNIICPGAVAQAETADYYRAADLLVLPSFGEGFPLVVQEAMASGTPCLVTNDTAAGIENPPSCLLTASLTTLAFGDAVRAFHRSGRQRDELRAEVSVVAQRLWNWSSVGREYLSLFRSIVRKEMTMVARIDDSQVTGDRDSRRESKVEMKAS